MSFTLRFPVQGVSKQPSMPEPERTPIRVTATDDGLPVTPVSLYSPRSPNGGIVPPKGGSPPIPIVPPAVPTNNVVASLGAIRMVLIERPEKTAADVETEEASLYVRTGLIGPTSTAVEFTSSTR